MSDRCSSARANTAISEGTGGVEPERQNVMLDVGSNPR
jgi:hypothetical protein